MIIGNIKTSTFFFSSRSQFHCGCIIFEKKGNKNTDFTLSTYIDFLGCIDCIQDEILKFSFSWKATKVWNYHPLDLTFTKQTSNQVGDNSTFLWPSQKS